MKWFKHGSNMRNDTKLRRVINKYGLEGYGLYNLIVESIVESLDNENPLPILEENIEDIAEFYNSNTTKISEMISFMVNQGLFEFTENKEIVCTKVYKHLQASQTRSEALREMILNFNKSKKNLPIIKTVSDKMQLVSDNKNDSNGNTPVSDICEEEKRIEETRQEENRREEKYFLKNNLDSFLKYWNSKIPKESLPSSLNINIETIHLNFIETTTLDDYKKCVDNYSEAYDFNTSKISGFRNSLSSKFIMNWFNEQAIENCRQRSQIGKTKKNIKNIDIDAQFEKVLGSE